MTQLFDVTFTLTAEQIKNALQDYGYKLKSILPAADAPPPTLVPAPPKPDVIAPWDVKRKAQPPRYLGGKRDKGIGGTTLILVSLPASTATLKRKYAERGFKVDSLSSRLFELRKAALVRFNQDTGMYERVPAPVEAQPLPLPAPAA
jgi:hypothetical protein